MSSWISVQESYPNNGDHVRIKVYNPTLDDYLEYEAIFYDEPTFRFWHVKDVDAKNNNNPTLPKYWKLTEEPIVFEKRKPNPEYPKVAYTSDYFKSLSADEQLDIYERISKL